MATRLCWLLILGCLGLLNAAEPQDATPTPIRGDIEAAADWESPLKAGRALVEQGHYQEALPKLSEVGRASCRERV